MTTSYQRRQQHNCLQPQQPVFLLMAFCPGEQKDNFPIVAPADGLTLQAAFIHRITGAIQRQTAINLLPDTKIHLFRSAFENWFYVAQHDNYRQRYDCSCRLRFCEHVKTLIALNEVK